MMNLTTLRDKILVGVIAACVITSLSVLIHRSISNLKADKEEVEIIEIDHEYLYGVCIDSLKVDRGVVESGNTLSTILEKFGIGAVKVDAILKAADGVFNFRDIRTGKEYTVMSDTMGAPQYFVYDISVIDYVVIDLGDSTVVYKGAKEVERRRMMKNFVIESSLWNAMTESGASGALAMDLSDVFQWSIDFFGIQKGDDVTVIYDEMYVDDKSIGAGTIYGSVFTHSGKPYYAIRFSYDEKGKEISGYWDEEGKSLKSAFLKAPLKYSRISSKFSNSRLHPVLRIRRPHHGVDYAAPSGTPVFAIGDGTITHRAYAGGNGNYIKIKHPRGYISGYLHLKGFAKGISVGTHVQQGQLIGYVGSTGTSTGPHLDFRIWKNGTPIDPLKLGAEKGKDIDTYLKTDYDIIKSRILSELLGEEYVEPTDSLAVDSLITTTI